MDSTSHLPSDPIRRMPSWPPYVARGDEEDDVFEAGDLMALPPSPRATAWEAPGGGRTEHEHATPWRGEEHARSAWQAESDARDQAFLDGEVLFASYGRPEPREPRHRPIIALTVNSLGYHLFVSHEAKKVLVRLGLILLAVLMMLLWGDIAQAVELFFNIFVL